VLGTSELDGELLDAAALCGHLVAAGSVEGFLAEHRRRLFPEAMFADLFPSGRGRPSIPGEVIATVMVLQSLHGLSDREALRELRTNIAWKVPAGLALTDEGFDPTVLVYWRNRLRGSSIDLDPPRPGRAVPPNRASAALPGRVERNRERATRSGPAPSVQCPSRSEVAHIGAPNADAPQRPEHADRHFVRCSSGGRMVVSQLKGELSCLLSSWFPSGHCSLRRVWPWPGSWPVTRGGRVRRTRWTSACSASGARSGNFSCSR
jgi:hypothetical protein